jgi:hypothetical protein
MIVSRLGEPLKDAAKVCEGDDAVIGTRIQFVQNSHWSDVDHNRWDLVIGCGVVLLFGLLSLQSQSILAQDAASKCPLIYINTAFENASPLYWRIDDSGEVNVFLLYDHERSSPNRAAGHWHFRVEAPKGSQLTIVLNNQLNIYNGREASPASEETITFVSPDGEHWQAMETELLDEHRLRFQLRMQRDQMYVARLEPYRLSDLKRLLDELSISPHVNVQQIGKTVEGRPLEIIRVGHESAPHRLLVRARAHAWEPGGNWVIQGMLRRLVQSDDRAAQFRARYCVYVMPMANKDGVVRGWTRFNVRGKDLNRNWDAPADIRFAPENYALEEWIVAMNAKGQKPDFMIDFHNDQGGRVHISRPNVDLDAYLEFMQRFERLLRKHTWFTEGATGGNYRNPGTIGEGLLERYGIFACVHELNANRIAGLDDYPSGKHWELYGAQLCEVFLELFGQ